MRKYSFRAAVVYSLMAITGIGPVAVMAQGTGSPDTTIQETPRTDSDDALIPPGQSEAAADASEAELLPSALRDASFDRYVDLNQIAAAVGGHNASLLTDVALQLAEGERILLRPHASGLTSKKLMSTAARMAASTQDKPALERLAKAAANTKDAALSEKIQAAQQLANASRSADPTLSVAIDTTTLEAVSELKNWLDVVQAASVVGDEMALLAILAALDDAQSLSEAQKAALTRQIEEGLASIPEADKEDPLLIQLAGTSRSDSDRQAVRDRITTGGWYVVWGKTIAAGEYAGLVASIASGTVAAYFGALLDQNIVKIQKQLPGVAKSVLIDAFKRAMKGTAIIRVGKIGIKGGIATYRYWNTVTIQVPDGTEKYKIKGPLGTWTWGYRPKFKSVTKQVPAEPNNHQPYFGFRTF